MRDSSPAALCICHILLSLSTCQVSDSFRRAGATSSSIDSNGLELYPGRRPSYGPVRQVGSNPCPQFGSWQDFPCGSTSPTAPVPG
ncbi:hypothetical protein BO71DRAFT_79924 [Aspergillus ellipticus CBS 707.79]|uniref:Secreted protein n=1 Tax=Aspergillus ellipticus CBS 707.79 TaxID=1448320 RepID=A0A319CZH3_9EURO|nr:hypothetical protein BO71DRAFT_79924 [Aspergillus ellipticus CBS 707.79]